MFENGFPREWSTIKKLAWLFRSVINAVIPVLKTIIGNPIHILDALAKPVQALSVKLEPIQDLHGYDSPWPAGGGKNLLPMTLANIQAINTAGTWNSNVYTYQDVTYTVNVDDGGNVVSINVNGTASGYSLLRLFNTMTTAEETKLSGCPSGASYTTFRLVADASIDYQDIGYGATIPANTEVDRFIIVVSSGVTISNKVFYPMLRLSTVTDASFAPYSNICPIYGHTDADVVRTGVNVWDEEWEIGSISATTGQNTTDNSVIRSKNYIPILPNTEYFGCVVGASSGYNFRARFYDSNKNFIGTGTNGLWNYNRSYKSPVDAAYLRFAMQSDYGTTYNHDISINYPSTETGCHAYVGTTYPIPLGQTVYGGTLDVLTGLLTVTHEVVDLGTLTWKEPQTTPYGAINHSVVFSSAKRPVDSNTRANIICSMFKTGISNTAYLGNTKECVCLDVGGNLAIYSNEYDSYTAAQFKVAMSGVQLCYELATPIEIQLTPQQIELLQGENNIWSDGTMTLVYLADGNASDVEALNILLGGRYVNNHTEDEPTDREALSILLGGTR